MTTPTVPYRLTSAGKHARNAYARAWRKANRDKVEIYQARYYNKLADTVARELLEAHKKNYTLANQLRDTR